MDMKPVSDNMRSEIMDRLADIAAEEGVTVLLAIESGSRAWGFHSPDSDYDVRFIYAEPVDWHLQLGPKRDVIERPIDDELDVSGWSLSKALGLMMNGNAVVAEWLQSPIVYQEATGARQALLDFAQSALQRRPVTWHYSRLLHNQLKRTFDDDGAIRLKRFFYAIRPALALRWMRVNGRAVPPMDMTTLRAGCDLPAGLEQQLDDLLLAKSKARETGTAPAGYDALQTLVRDELRGAEEWLDTDAEKQGKPHLIDRASDLHRHFCQLASG